MPLIGIWIILGCLSFGFWWITTRGYHKTAIIALSSIGMFVGLTFVLQDRITELSIKGIGSIKAATDQATADAYTIAQIRDRIENQSATVDSIASEASKARDLSKNVEEQSKLATKILNDLDHTIKDARELLEKIKDEIEFERVVISAQNDDRSSWDKLLAISKDSTSPFADLAQKAWNTIFESHSSPMYTSNLQIPWTPGFRHEKLWLPELVAEYRAAAPALKPALIEYIWKREDIKRLDKLDFFITILESDQSLSAVEYAGRYFTSGTNQQIKPLAVDFLVSWWKEHRKEFE